MRKLFRQIIFKLLQIEARLVLKRFHPTIIGITGSVGKTSTKEAIATLLSQFVPVRKSPKSYNSEIGIPLTILNLENAWHSPLGWIKNILLGLHRVFISRSYPQVLVLEMGVDRPGDFDSLLEWIKPDIAVITAIGDVPVHVEFFEGPEDVAHEKAKLAHAVSKEGTVILNTDDPLVAKMKSKTKANIITYGFSAGTDVRGSMYKPTIRRGKPEGLTFKIDHEGKTVPIKVPGIIGKQNAYSFLASAAVGIAQDLNLLEISEGIAKMKPLPGRMHIIQGIKKSTILDDTYNASPIAVRSALEVLESIPAKRKIAVLGDMLELGKYTPEEHRKIGVLASSVANLVIAVGLRAKFMETPTSKAFRWFPNSDEAAEHLLNQIEEEDLILIKGSQGIRMEKITKVLMARPEDAHKELVRQDAYWKSH